MATPPRRHRRHVGPVRLTLARLTRLGKFLPSRTFSTFVVLTQSYFQYFSRHVGPSRGSSGGGSPVNDNDGRGVPTRIPDLSDPRSERSPVQRGGLLG
jgi:hypothetical protein